MGCNCSKAVNATAPVRPPGAGAGAGAATGSSSGAADPLAMLKETAEGAKADYTIGDLLGKGSFGNVYRGVHKKTREPVALKVMVRSKVKATSIHREYNVLEHITHHPYVVDYKGTYKTKEEVTFVLEVMEGGELFDRLIRRGAYGESDARLPFKRIAEALAFLHSRGIIHRDLKPENILLKDDSDNPVLKIADFGLSQLIGPNERLLKVCGTWAYAAPEMSDPARPGYDCRFDCFSFGVILYVVLSGSHPFDAQGNAPVHEIKARARAARFDYDGEEWSLISDRAKDLIRRLIVKDPEQRMDSETMLRHPWFSDILDPTLELDALLPAEDLRARAQGQALEIERTSDGFIVGNAVLERRRIVIDPAKRAGSNTSGHPPGTAVGNASGSGHGGDSGGGGVGGSLAVSTVGGSGAGTSPTPGGGHRQIVVGHTDSGGATVATTTSSSGVAQPPADAASLSSPASAAAAAVYGADAFGGSAAGTMPASAVLRSSMTAAGSPWGVDPRTYALSQHAVTGHPSSAAHTPPTSSRHLGGTTATAAAIGLAAADLARFNGLSAPTMTHPGDVDSYRGGSSARPLSGAGVGPLPGVSVAADADGSGYSPYAPHRDPASRAPGASSGAGGMGVQPVLISAAASRQLGLTQGMVLRTVAGDDGAMRLVIVDGTAGSNSGSGGLGESGGDAAGAAAYLPHAASTSSGSAMYHTVAHGSQPGAAGYGSYVSGLPSSHAGGAGEAAARLSTLAEGTGEDAAGLSSSHGHSSAEQGAGAAATVAVPPRPSGIFGYTGPAYGVAAPMLRSPSGRSQLPPGFASSHPFASTGPMTPLGGYSGGGMRGSQSAGDLTSSGGATSGGAASVGSGGSSLGAGIGIPGAIMSHHQHYAAGGSGIVFASAGGGGGVPVAYMGAGSSPHHGGVYIAPASPHPSGGVPVHSSHLLVDASGMPATAVAGGLASPHSRGASTASGAMSSPFGLPGQSGVAGTPIGVDGMTAGDGYGGVAFSVSRDAAGNLHMVSPLFMAAPPRYPHAASRTVPASPSHAIVPNVYRSVMSNASAGAGRAAVPGVADTSSEAAADQDSGRDRPRTGTGTSDAVAAPGDAPTGGSSAAAAASEPPKVTGPAAPGSTRHTESQPPLPSRATAATAPSPAGDPAMAVGARASAHRAGAGEAHSGAAWMQQQQGRRHGEMGSSSLAAAHAASTGPTTGAMFAPTGDDSGWMGGRTAVAPTLAPASVASPHYVLMPVHDALGRLVGHVPVASTMLGAALQSLPSARDAASPPGWHRGGPPTPHGSDYHSVPPGRPAFDLGLALGGADVYTASSANLHSVAGGAGLSWDGEGGEGDAMPAVAGGGGGGGSSSDRYSVKGTQSTGTSGTAGGSSGFALTGLNARRMEGLGLAALHVARGGGGALGGGIGSGGSVHSGDAGGSSSGVMLVGGALSSGGSGGHGGSVGSPGSPGSSGGRAVSGGAPGSGGAVLVGSPGGKGGGSGGGLPGAVVPTGGGAPSFAGGAVGIGGPDTGMSFDSRVGATHALSTREPGETPSSAGTASLPSATAYAARGEATASGFAGDGIALLVGPGTISGGSSIGSARGAGAIGGGPPHPPPLSHAPAALPHPVARPGSAMRSVDTQGRPRSAQLRVQARIERESTSEDDLQPPAAPSSTAGADPLLSGAGVPAATPGGGRRGAAAGGMMLVANGEARLSVSRATPSSAPAASMTASTRTSTGPSAAASSGKVSPLPSADALAVGSSVSSSQVATVRIGTPTSGTRRLVVADERGTHVLGTVRPGAGRPLSPLGRGSDLLLMTHGAGLPPASSTALPFGAGRPLDDGAGEASLRPGAADAAPDDEEMAHSTASAPFAHHVTRGATGGDRAAGGVPQQNRIRVSSMLSDGSQSSGGGKGGTGGQAHSLSSNSLVGPLPGGGAGAAGGGSGLGDGNVSNGSNAVEMGELTSLGAAAGSLAGDDSGDGELSQPHLPGPARADTATATGAGAAAGSSSSSGGAGVRVTAGVTRYSLVARSHSGETGGTSRSKRSSHAASGLVEGASVSAGAGAGGGPAADMPRSASASVSDGVSRSVDRSRSTLGSSMMPGALPEASQASSSSGSTGAQTGRSVPPSSRSTTTHSGAEGGAGTAITDSGLRVA